MDSHGQRWPDIGRARSVLGWEKAPLETGLKRTIAYFDRLLSADAAEKRKAAVAV